MEFYTQYDQEFERIVDVERENFRFTYAAILGNIVGRNGNWDPNRHNRWRTAVPFLGSLAHWLFTGRKMARGNTHVQNWDHSAGGENSNTMSIDFTPGQSSALIECVRSLFTYAEVQRTNAARYYKHMALVDTANNLTYLIKLKWYRRRNMEDVAVEVKVFGVPPIATPVNVDFITRQFRALGFSD